MPNPPGRFITSPVTSACIARAALQVWHNIAVTGYLVAATGSFVSAFVLAGVPALIGAAWSFGLTRFDRTGRCLGGVGGFSQVSDVFVVLGLVVHCGQECD